MKIINFLSLFGCVFSTLFPTIFGKHGVGGSTKREQISYNASISEQSVQTLFDNLIDNQSDIVLNNYSTIYFSNLTNNFPINSHGTCSYVGISMLLSFFDSYWDDEFIGETFEQNISYESTISSNQNLDIPSLDTESPGIISENWNDVNGLTLSQYQNFILANQDIYLQSYLIKLQYDMFGGYCFDNSTNPYGMTLYDQTHLTLYYLMYKRNLYNSQSFVSSFTNYNQDDLEEYIVSRLLDGIPVMINALTSVGYHSMIAYDYNSSDGSIYVHTGWKDENGNAATHVSLNQLGVTLSSIDSAISIEPTNVEHGYHSTNYISSSNSRYCSCQLIYPRNIRMASGNYMDINPCFKWDSLYEEKWFNDYNPYIELSVLNQNQTILFTKNIYNGNEYVLTDEEWHNLNIIDSSNDYYVHIKLCSNTYSFSNNYCRKNFNKPSDYLLGEPITITPSDYTGYTSNYDVAEDSRYNFSSHITPGGYLFKTRRFRAGYIHNECIVLSPKRFRYKEAFIEYQFIFPIDRIDIELSYWSEIETEGLTSSNGKAVIEVYKYGNYNTTQPALDLLSSSANLSENRNDKTVYKLCFSRPITRFRLYTCTYNTNMNLVDRGRICIGNIKLYENRTHLEHGNYIDIQISGSEIDYNPEFWNIDGVQNINNCYSYAINYISDIHINPGEIGCPYYTRIFDSWNNFSNYLTENNFYNMVNFDSEPGVLSNYGFEFTRVDKDDEVPFGAYRVALVFDLVNYDYHWYRQNPDGSWSHKPGGGEVRDFDFDGNPIMDPEFCNRNSSLYISDEINNMPDFNYSTFIGFYAIRWRVQIE